MEEVVQRFKGRIHRSVQESLGHGYMNIESSLKLFLKLEALRNCFTTAFPVCGVGSF